MDLNPESYDPVLSGLIVIRRWRRHEGQRFVIGSCFDQKNLASPAVKVKSRPQSIQVRSVSTNCVSCLILSICSSHKFLGRSPHQSPPALQVVVRGAAETQPVGFAMRFRSA